MQRHRPVVGDRVDDVLHTGVDRRLCRPYVGADHRDILGNVAEHRRHELGVFLVGGVVADLAEALVVGRLPDDLVEHAALLRQARAERIEVVLRADDLGAGGVGKGIEIHPVGRVAHRMRRRSHGDRNAVVTEAHADVADDDALFTVEGDLARSLRHADILHAQRLVEHGVFHQLHRIVGVAVVAVFSLIFLLAAHRLAIGFRADGIAEDDF